MTFTTPAISVCLRGGESKGRGERMNVPKRVVQRFSHSRFAKNNKWVALPILTMFGAGGAVWGAYAMIAQGLAVLLDKPQAGDNYLNSVWYYRLAISCAIAGFCFGTMELLRVLGKTLILDEAEKIRVAMYTFEQNGSPEVKEIAQKICSQLRGRPDKNSIGELDYLVTRLRRGESLSKVLHDFHDLLSVKARSEALKNPIITAWNYGDISETSALLSARG